VFALFVSTFNLPCDAKANDNEGLDDPSATVLLITNVKLAKAWRPFADWKTRLGKATHIVTVQEIEKTYKGVDTQDKIRKCVLDYCDNHGTRWVILGGDSEPGGKGVVPDRDTLHDLGGLRYADIPTDIYFLSKRSWDENEDGIYGDWKNDRDAVSYINTKASIGSIPVRTEKHIADYTAKVIAYESNYPTKEFADKLVYACPIPMAYPKLNTSKSEVGVLWKRGKILQYFSEKTPWDKDEDGDHDLSPENWINFINQKTAGKVHVHGHGFLPLWVLEGNKTFENRHVDKLTNENAYLAMTTVSCFTGQYDSRKDPSITEAMLRKAKAGAVLIVAPSREGVPIFHNPRVDFRLMVSEGKMDGTTTTMTRFWKYALDKEMTAGEALRAAKSDMVKDAGKTAGFHFLQCELNLLGDPTLDLRPTNPVTPKILNDETIKRGSQELTVKTNSPNTNVCVWKGSECYVVAKTDEKGMATVEIAPKTAGDLLITLSGPRVNAVTKTVTVK